MMKPILLPLTALTLLPACAGGGGGVAPLPAVNVHASAETAPVGTGNADAADDPAIWRNPADPAASLIVGTDKKAGLYVYGLDGKVKSFLDAGAVNNVDLLGGSEQALVVASDRNDLANSKLALFTLRFDDPVLKPLGAVESGPGEAYGVCLQRRDVSADLSALTAYAAIKDGTVREIMLTRRGDGGYDGRVRRQWKLASQIEGCVTSPRSGDLYIGEEDVGIWRIRAMIMDAAPQPEVFATVGSEGGLVADVEGLAYAMNPDAKDLLLASSQGDNAYAVFDTTDGKLLGRFRIADGTEIDGTSETDGIELMLGDFGPTFPGGLFIAQDGSNPGAAQNFKLVSWQAIVDALDLAH
ncbi:MAG: phytase [Sphingobium sp.]